MRYAVIKTGGKQYRVSEGDELEVEKLKGEKGEKFDIEDVLLFLDKDKLELGKPIVKNVKVNVEILEQKKADKIKVARFRSKKRYHKVKGHRQNLTRIKINKITHG